MFSKFLQVLMLTLFIVVSNNAQTCTTTNIPAGLVCKERTLPFIGGQRVAVRVYTKGELKKITKTFVVVHANEEKGLDSAKKIIARHGGRLVEIVSNAPENKIRRYLYFGDNKSKSIDPNRIYTECGRIKVLNGSACNKTTVDATTLSELATFADEFIKLVTKPVGGPLQSLIVGVHNNSIKPNDPDEDLLLNSWSGGGKEADTAIGIFSGNNHTDGQKVFPSDTDEFVMATNGFLAGQLLDNKIHAVALQEGLGYLLQNRSSVDDGSMSIYFGMTLIPGSAKPFSYIVIEAGGYDNTPDTEPRKSWQMKTIETILLKVKAF